MNVLIIEDEEAAARRLEKLVLGLEAQTTVLAKLDSIESVLNWLEQHELPDLVFMDIHLADGSSFEVFNHVKIDCPIIFTTAYDQYAIQAFRVNAVDYLLKPIKREELRAALDKYQRQSQPQTTFNYQQLAQSIKEDPYNRRFLIRIGQNIKVVDANDAAYFYTEDKITFVVTHDGKRYPLDHSLEKLEEMLDPRRFFRVNRQVILGLEAIREMYAYSKSRVKVELEPPADMDIIVSTERSPHFKKWLTGEE
ncbi:MAG: response regulator [Bacteroidetes bacterium]|jgi:two-component system LytT family response regulator|nr:response regulator [Bacteroidota bacterium]HKK78037.1 LytTR family DNA-binding domain-containing protein [Phaeodactylibacter sp.]